MEKPIDKLLEKVKGYLNNEDSLKLIEKAYQFIEEHYQDNNQISKEEMLVSSLAVALILTDIHVDDVSICAALLHNIVEQDNHLIKKIEEEFGQEVVSILEGLLKIGQINFSTGMAVNIDYYKRILIGISEDVRVIIIVLAERLYNMRNLNRLSTNKQKIRAKETLEIFTPIAHRLGINHIKSELEDLSLRFLKPDVYADIEAKLIKSDHEREETVNQMLKELTKLLNDNDIKYEIKGRAKSIYGIYKKLDKGRPFSDIYDIYALRIIVDTEQECYLVLGLIHSHYKPIPKRFKDYIAMPKANMYQSLHTTVFGPNGDLYEIQIRTHEMDEVAEFGYAAHWSYKQDFKSKKTNQKNVEQKLDLFRSIIDLDKEKTTTEDFINAVNDEVINTNIYVFTPKGDVVELPTGSTPIDFAYKVHTQIGEKMVGAVVNNVIVPLSYTLNNGDVVKITTNKNSIGPSKEWIKIAKSSQTKNKIKAFFNRIDKNDYINKGKELLEKELRRKKLAFKDVLNDYNIKQLLSKLKTNNIDDIYYEIGYNNYTPGYILNLILKDNELDNISYKVKSDLRHLQNTKDLLLVDGVDAIKINLASCCTPIIGDDIVGYITKGSGITAHRKDCSNVNNDTARQIKVYWNNNIEQKLPTNIIVETIEKEKTLKDIVSLAESLDITIDSISTQYKRHNIIYNIMILVANIDSLNKFFNELYKLPYIERVERKTK